MIGYTMPFLRIYSQAMGCQHKPYSSYAGDKIEERQDRTEEKDSEDILAHNPWTEVQLSTNRGMAQAPMRR